jgi:NADH-quinone oxidoreductase subunit F
MVGTRISIDDPNITYSVDIATKKQNAQFIYMHPIDDIALQNKYTQFSKYEAGSEEGVLALLASYLIKDIPAKYKQYFDDMDIGYLSGETSVGEEELESIVNKLIKSKKKILVIGEDLYGHPKASNIAKLIGLIDCCTDFEVIIIQPQTNTLDDTVSSKVVDYTLDEVDSISTFNGTVIYRCKPLPLQSNTKLQGSSSFATAAKIKDGDTVNITYDGKTMTKDFKLDSTIKGTIALYPTHDDEFQIGYRFKQVKIEKVEV